jgi:hypothetical protein
MATRQRKNSVLDEEVVEEPEVEEVEELDLEDLAEEVETEEVEDDDGTGALSAKEVATRLGVDARTFRKFLRSIRGKVGQGNRWHIDPEDFDELKVQFEN